MTVIFADSNRARIRYIRSTAGWGTTPTSGKTRELRFTGSTINAMKETVISEEIRADRMVADVIEVGAKSTGDTNGEFSAGTHDDFLEGFAFGAWSRPMTFDSLKGDLLSWGSTSTILAQGVDFTPYYTVGHRIRTEGFVNPANNDYFQISAIAFDGSKTTITTVASTGAVEVGSAASAVYDANDVVVLKNTAIRFGTAGAPTIDSDGGNAFAAAIAAGQLLPGQNIFVETSVGMGVGSFTFTAQPTAGDQVVVNDGVNPQVTFQFGGVVANGVVEVPILGTDILTVTALVAAINEQRALGTLAVAASYASLAATIKNLNEVGGALTAPVNTGTVNTVVTFTGGVATRGIYKVESATNDVLTVSPAPPTNANSGTTAVTIKGSMLRNPSDPVAIIPPDFVFETGFTDVSQFFVTDGLKVSSVSIEVAASAITKTQFGFHGRATIRQPASVLGGESYTSLATTSTEVVNATVNVGVIKLNGAALSTALQSLTFTGDNALRDQMAVGDKFPAGIGAGRQVMKGAVKAYFADGTLWDHFINHDTVSLNFYIQDQDGHHYEFTIPAAKFSTDTVNPSAGNQDVMEDMEYEAFRDPVTDCQFQIDRFSNIHPISA